MPFFVSKKEIEEIATRAATKAALEHTEPLLKDAQKWLMTAKQSLAHAELSATEVKKMILDVEGILARVQALLPVQSPYQK